jgi:hypothetical protein
MWDFVPLESARESIVIHFPPSQFQSQQATIDLLPDSDLLFLFWTWNSLKACSGLVEKKLEKLKARSEHKPRKSLRFFEQEIQISKSSVFDALSIQIRIYWGLLIMLWNHVTRLPGFTFATGFWIQFMTMKFGLTEEDLKKNIWGEIFEVTHEEILQINLNIFKWHRNCVHG